jgi:hypothetical protein
VAAVTANIVPVDAVMPVVAVVLVLLVDRVAVGVDAAGVRVDVRPRKGSPDVVVALRRREAGVRHDRRADTPPISHGRAQCARSRSCVPVADQALRRGTGASTTQTLPCPLRAGSTRDSTDG